jgi:fluoroquinolone resistance protein
MIKDQPNEHEGKTFEKTDYQAKIVSERKFIDCLFKNCNLSNTVFKDCLFDDCVFDGCDLSLMKVKGSTFKRIQLINSKAIGLQWFDALNPFSIQCTDSNISYSSFFAKDLKKAKFLRCNAQQVDFTDCNLTGVVFAGTDLTDARFSNCDLSFANFKEAKNYSFDVRENKIKKTVCGLPEALSLLNYFGIIVD